MSEIAGLAASAAGGGLFGLVGTMIGRAAGFLERRQSHAQERARWAHDIRMQEMQSAVRREETEAEKRLAEESGRWEGLAASLQAEASIGATYAWVNAVRALTRPVLTVLLWGVVTIAFVDADAAGRTGIIETATFAATAATLWWFGDRGPRRMQR